MKMTTNAAPSKVFVFFEDLIECSPVGSEVVASVMKIRTVFLYALAVVSVVKSSTDRQVDTDDMVPFYLKRDETNPNGIVAVVYYGELGDASKEIEVPCTMNMQDRDKYVGPESITCHCMSMRRLYFGCHGGSLRSSNSSNNAATQTFANSRCELQVPFHVNRDMNGTIISVEFNKDYTNSTEDPVLVVPFYSTVDKDGNIVAVMVSNEQDSSSSSSLSPLLIACIAAGSVLIFLFGLFIVKKRRDNVRKIGKVSMVSNKMVANPMRSAPASQAAPHDDDDTMTEASNSVADRI
jgi:hypothetical protein